MAKFTLRIPEVHYQDFTVEAESPEEAIKLFNDGEADMVDDTLDYSHVVDPDTDEQQKAWVVAQDGKPL